MFIQSTFVDWYIRFPFPEMVTHSCKVAISPLDLNFSPSNLTKESYIYNLDSIFMMYLFPQSLLYEHGNI